jgi:purine-binding chemotaxis protein CheW
MRSVLLLVGRDWFALPMAAFQEVVADPVVTALPAAPPTVRGLFNVRGQIIPLLDTGVLLGLGPLPGCSFAAVVQSRYGPAGLATTGPPEPAELAWRVGPAHGKGTVAAYAAGERIAVLLDPMVLLAPADVAAES